MRNLSLSFLVFLGVSVSAGAQDKPSVVRSSASDVLGEATPRSKTSLAPYTSEMLMAELGDYGQTALEQKLEQRLVVEGSVTTRFWDAALLRSRFLTPASTPKFLRELLNLAYH